jgi:hypothetical protein
MNRRTWTNELLIEVGHHFGLGGEFIEGGPYGSGHINDTFAVVYDQAGTRIRYIHQRLNSNVFKNPRAVMENVAVVCRHTAAKLAQSAPPGDVSRRSLTLLPTREGDPAWSDDAEDYWRTYYFIEKAATHDLITNATQAFEAARAFGAFQAMLSDLPSEKLHEIIPDFHHTRKRLDVLRQAVKADSHGRAAQVQEEIDFALSRESLANSLLDLAEKGAMPVRITHNDTKLNNVMLDDQSGEGICVIDLDTVMPGLSLYDFGDMVRTATSPAAEDERDLSQVRARPEMFEALARGFLSTAGSFLNEAERSNMITAGKLMTYECGIRFLTDFLSGDTYFKIKREGHNLDRCRTQFQLVRSLDEQEAELEKILAQIP